MMTTRDELLDFMFSETPSAIWCWATEMTWIDTEDGDGLTFREVERGEEQYTLTLQNMRTGANKWAKWATGHFSKDSFAYRAARAWQFDVDSFDYDADVIDQIVQFAVIGEIVYG